MILLLFIRMFIADLRFILHSLRVARKICEKYFHIEQHREGE